MISNCLSLGLLVTMLFFCSSILNAQSLRSMNKKTNNYQFPACPQSPNCVSSVSQDPKHKIPALSYDNIDGDEAMNLLKKVFHQLTNQVQVLEQGRVLHAETKSTIFGFIDDVDAYLNTDQQRIEIRSASRTGYYDFGVNKRRVNKISELFRQQINNAKQ